MIRRLRMKMYDSIWFYPAVISIMSILAALITREIDTGSLTILKDIMPGVLLTGTSLAKTIHVIIAGAFITITTFTFSTTMIVLTMYMSQLSPRVVDNFLNNKSTMRSFGVFLGGFTYSILSLLFTRGGDDVLVVSASFGVIYIAVGLFHFIIFINDVSRFIKLSNVIERLHREAVANIESYTKLLEESEYVAELPVQRGGHRHEVYSQSSGYIQHVERSRLKRLADKYEMTIVFERVTGQYVYEKTLLYTIYFDNDEPEIDEMEKSLRGAVELGQHKTEEQDFSFTIQKIVEVALRAISPGVNDPNTAIHCIRILGTLVGRLNQLERGYIRLLSEDDSEYHTYIESYSFDRIMHDAFDQIAHFGYTDPSVMTAEYKALRHLITDASSANRRLIIRYCRELHNRIINQGGYTDYELKSLQEEFADIID